MRRPPGMSKAEHDLMLCRMVGDTRDAAYIQGFIRMRETLAAIRDVCREHQTTMTATEGAILVTCELVLAEVNALESKLDAEAKTL